MPVFLLILGAAITAAVINDKLGDLGKLASGDLFGAPGQPGFIVWAGAIVAIGAIFKIIDLPDAGRGLVFLVCIAFILGHNQIPQQILAALEGAGHATPPPVAPSLGQQAVSAVPATPALPALPAAPALSGGN